MTKILILFCFFQIQPPVSAEDRDYIGAVSSLTGKVYFRETKGSARSELQPERDRWKYLFTGNEIHTANGSIVILLRSGDSVTNRAMASNVWVPVDTLAHERRTSPVLATADLVALGLVPAGRKMAGGPSDIFEPANDGAILSTNNVIRWIPPSEKQGKAILELKDAAGRIRWSASVDLQSGTLVDPNLAKILTRTMRGLGPLQLRLSNNDGVSISSKFSLLSEKEESDFRQQLESLEKIEDLQERLLARAGLAQKLNLLNEVASTLDQLVHASASQNPTLLKLALEKQMLIGNKPRALEITKQLDALSP